MYSIDESFIDVTSYLGAYKKSPKELAVFVMNEIAEKLHIPSTAGIGTNLYLAKIALDITAKHAKDHIGYFNEELYRETLWDHKPITDFWQIAGGTARRLEKYGITTMRGIANFPEDILYKTFGINAELLIDHAWGRENCRISDIKNYKTNEYYDYNIVMSLPNGRPMEGQVISRSFKRLIRKNNLPDVVFHSLRHSSTTYKLKLNGGDMKSVQGDTGHAQLKMVSDVYSHILDEDRRHNAEMFEEAFYKKTPTAQEKKTSTSTDAQQVMELLNASPDLASQLLKMLQIVNGGTQNAV